MLRIPSGFRMAAVHCGVKADPVKNDLALIVCERGATAAGVYTQNVVHASSVSENRKKTPGNNFRVIVVNSGNANACTGRRGLQDTREMARLAGQSCGATPQQTLVMSTGVIGEYLPMQRISAGITEAAARLSDDEAALLEAENAMMTTDQYPKLAGRTVDLSDGPAQITGMAKGAGMIAPNMATLLVVLLTDAALSPRDAQRVLTEAVDSSFNCISVEGHTSTSDMALLLTSGARTGPALEGNDLASFQGALEEICIELAKMIPNDGEGASHLITINVLGCATEDEARRIARAVGNSPLVKTGIAGADPNWGRIVSAAGYAGVQFDPDRLRLRLNGMLVYEQGAPVAFDAATLSASLRDHRETSVELSLAAGDAAARFWTSDLTTDYVRFNSEYTT